MLNHNYRNIKNIFETTYQDLPKKLNELHYSSNSYLRVVIEVIENDYIDSKPENDTSYQFLNDYVWDDDNTPVDLAENHDEYLYSDEYYA